VRISGGFAKSYGESGLKAFAYFLSPGFGKRVGFYPAEYVRGRNLQHAAVRFNIELSGTSFNVFEKARPLEGSTADIFCVSLADSVLETQISDLVRYADKFVADAHIVMHSEEETQRVLDRIRLVVPAEQCKTIADILNAAWLAKDDQDLWREYPSLRKRKDDVLKELALKNLEVFEIEQLQRTP
jgi:hypothetical protein